MKNDFSKYYTPINVALPLVKMIKFKTNSNVIDICCGSGNLLQAAKNVKNTLFCSGVDIENNLLESNIDIVKNDGRRFALEHVGEYDYALANPPFGQTNSAEYSDALFRDSYELIRSSRLEIEMLIANLIILKENGILLIILPSTIVTGVSTINIRKCLAKNHFISAIIDLPLNAFYPEKIKCSALIVEKKARVNKETKTYQMDESYEIVKQCSIGYNDMINGIWYKKIYKNTPEFNIKQGSISSQDFADVGEEVLHTGKRCISWNPTIRYAQLSPNRSYTMVEDGDIIISRIGASAGQKCLYTGKQKYISDCLFVIKTKTKEITNQIMNLDLEPLVGGLSTPHLTATNIIGLYNETYKKE